MTKAKIVVAAKVGHPLVVVQVADAVRAHVAIHQPRGAFTKPAPPHPAVHRAMRRPKKPSARVAQLRHARQATARVKNVPLSREPSAASAIVQRV